MANTSIDAHAANVRAIKSIQSKAVMLLFLGFAIGIGSMITLAYHNTQYDNFNYPYSYYPYTYPNSYVGIVLAGNWYFFGNCGNNAGAKDQNADNESWFRN